ncbi:MAG: elongation factor P [Methylacidiphilales bacterium]|nr:elongation factor P [Candidatus Methylacidiphilales bacterium]
MTQISTNEFKAGVKIILDGDPYSIIENEFVKPGKGQAFNRVRIRNLKNGKVVDRTFKSNDTVELADILDTEVQYLYADAEFCYFMNPESFEQISANKQVVGESLQWLKEQEICFITLWNGVPLQVTPPQTVKLLITQTDPGIKGDTATGGTKPATLETGAVVKVPLFMQEGELVLVDTRKQEYLSRAKS